MTPRFGLLCSASLCIASAATAQDQTIALDPIRIESDQAQAVLGNDEITAEEIARRNPATMADVFRGESAVTAGGGAPIAQKVFVNGIEESLLSVTIDGARQNKSAFHHTGNVLFDPALLKSVEISAGLAPADAGPNALAGAIAYTTKNALDLLPDGQQFGGRAQLGYGTNGRGVRGTLSLYGHSGNFDYLLSGTRASGDAYDDGDGNEVLGTEADLTDFTAKAGLDLGHGRLEFSASQTKDSGARAAQGGPGGITILRPDFGGVVGVDSTLVDGLSKRTSYALTYQGTAGLTAQLTHNRQEIDVVGVWGENTSLSGVVKQEFNLANGTVTAGVDFFDETAEGRGRGPGPFGSSGEEKLRNFGLFAQARQDIGDRVSVSYGGRYDWQKFEGANGQEFKDNGLSANGSIDIRLTDMLTFNAGLASSWGGYELGEAALVNFFTPWTYDGFTASRAQAGRVGLRFENGPWAAKLAYFQTKVDDITAVLPSGGQRGATANLETKGIDGAVSYTGDRGYFALNVTKADVQLDEQTIGTTAFYLGRPVGTMVGLSAGYQVTDELEIGGDAQFAFENDDTPVTLPGYEVVNLYAAYRPQAMDGMEIRLGVFNLMDEQYSKRSSDGVGSTRVIPLNEPGRTVALTASFAF